MYPKVAGLNAADGTIEKTHSEDFTKEDITIIAKHPRNIEFATDLNDDENEHGGGYKFRGKNACQL